MELPPSNPPPSEDPHQLETLKGIYTERDKTREFEEEEPVFLELLPLLQTKLHDSGYSLADPIGLGSTATVWVVKDIQLGLRRALKLPRPRLGKLQDIIEVIRAEKDRLATLSHENITRIYFASEIATEIGGSPYRFPFFIMDYLPGIRDLDDFVLRHVRSGRLHAIEVISYFRDVLLGVSYLHSNDVYHCDLKPGNLLISESSPALVADLGYAKHVSRLQREDPRETRVFYTPKYAHPDLRKRMVESGESNAQIASLERSELRSSFDLFALGRTFQEVLYKLRELELESNSAPSTETLRLFTPYQWRYLNLIATRLLDGIVENQDANPLLADRFSEFPVAVMSEIKYLSADEALEDIEKLLGLYDLEGSIPELNPNTPSYIQIPHAKVPVSPRVEAVIDHPRFASLAQVTQLGFVSLVYPGATHTRYEHVLGTFTRACDYVRALWYDHADCLFRSLMRREDLEACLLASLLHDIAQYPMAHDLAEISTEFEHDRFTQSALHECVDEDSGSLADLIALHWGINPNRLHSILSVDENSDLRDRILHSIISGAIDSDKADYLPRDSTHLGVPFGLELGFQRLLRNLTVVHRSAQKRHITARGEMIEEILEVAEIGVTEKALAAARRMFQARRDMFRQVYWQHTVRSLKAMLGFIVRSVLIRSMTDSTTHARFWEAFSIWRESFRSPSATELESDGVPEENQTPEYLRATASSGLYLSRLSASDDSLLELLRSFSTPAAQTMIDRIRRRRIYRRGAVISRERHQSAYKQFYQRFLTYRLDHGFHELEALRQRWQDEIVAIIEGGVASTPDESAIQALSVARSALGSGEPILLLDVPIKSTSRKKGAECLYYIPEEVERFPWQSGSPQESVTSADQETFDQEVGKIRVFVAPEWKQLVRSFVQEEHIHSLLSS